MRATLDESFQVFLHDAPARSTVGFETNADRSEFAGMDQREHGVGANTDHACDVFDCESLFHRLIPFVAEGW